MSEPAYNPNENLYSSQTELGHCSVMNKSHFLSINAVTLIILALIANAEADTAELLENTTEQCPDPAQYPAPLPSPHDPDHWFSPAGNNQGDKVSKQCNSCEDPRNTSDPSCIVYTTLTTSCKGKTSCTVPSKGTFNIYAKQGYALEHDLRYTDKNQPKYKHDTCHALIFALYPTIGIEDSNNRDNYNYWPNAYYASQQLIKPAIPSLRVGLAINPATERSQHQLHIHIGRLTDDFRSTIDQLEQNPKITQKKVIGGYSFTAKFVIDNKQGPFTGFSPFEAASNLAGGEKFIPEYGIIAVRAKYNKGTPRGIFVLVTRNVFVEGLLDYSYLTPNDCSLVKK